MRTHTVGVVTAPDKDGSFWAIEQYQDSAAHLHKYNLANYHNQNRNNFQILTDERTGLVTRSPQMIVDAQRMAQRDGNQEVVAATTTTLREMGNPSRTPSTEPGQQASAPNHTAPAAQPHGAHDGPRVLEQGAHGQDVHDLQAKLAKLGYKDAHGQPLTPDSHFGPDTKHAVQAFQRSQHLQLADGKVGPDTEKARCPGQDCFNR